MILPVSSEDGVARRTETTLVLIILNAGIFLLLPRLAWLLLAYHSKMPLWHQVMASVTSQFLHKDFSHLAGNMWFLWLFGPGVDGAFRRRFIPFYLVGGVVANLSMYFEMNQSYSLVGASGAIAAVIAAYCAMYPNSKIKCFAWFALSRSTVHVPAAAFGLMYFGWDYLMMQMTGSRSMVAYAAHLGGAAFGMLAGFWIGAAPAVLPPEEAAGHVSEEQAAAARRTLAMRVGGALDVSVAEPAADALAPAGVLARAGAVLIDFLALLVIVLALTLAAGPMPGAGSARTAIFWGAWAVYLAATTGLWGATPGKLAAGIRVVSVDAGPMGWPRALARAAASFLAFPLGLGALPALFGGHKRALHDRIAGTRAIYAPGVGTARRAAFSMLGLALPVYMLGLVVWVLTSKIRPRLAPVASIPHHDAKAELKAFRAGLDAYRRDFQGAPADLSMLVRAGYARAIPAVEVPGAHARSAEVHYQAGARSQVASDTGGWGYTNDPNDRDYGSLFINCTHTDAGGKRWDSY